MKLKMNKKELYILRLIINSFINLKDDEKEGGNELC